MDLEKELTSVDYNIYLYVYINLKPQIKMDSEENIIEQESLDFLTTCSVDDFVALYEHMTLCKLEEVQDDTLDLKYTIIESEGDP